MRIKTAIHFMLLPMPSMVKILVYRHLLRYRIGRNVKIGFSMVDVENCCIGDRTRIGHFNYIRHIKKLDVGSDVIVGHFNILMGGEEVRIGDTALIGRFNEINSIINPVATGAPDPRLIVGNGAVITAWHKIDYTDRVTIGDNSIIAGRHSCIWTHNRQQVKPVNIGVNCYVGSGIQMVPGSAIGSYCVIGLGAVITKPLTANRSVIAGVPAKVIKTIDEDASALVEYPTRPDLIRH